MILEVSSIFPAICIDILVTTDNLCE